jgi:hypothetical protein
LHRLRSAESRRRLCRHLQIKRFLAVHFDRFDTRQVLLRLDVARIGGQCIAVCGSCRSEAPGVLERHAQIVLKLRCVLLQRHGPRQQCQRVAGAFLFEKQETEVVHRPRISCVECDRATIRVRGIVGLVLCGVDAAKQALHVNRAGIDFARVREPDERIVEAVLIDQDSTQVDETLEVIRVDLQRLLECPLSLWTIASFPCRQSRA